MLSFFQNRGKIIGFVLSSMKEPLLAEQNKGVNKKREVFLGEIYSST